MTTPGPIGGAAGTDRQPALLISDEDVRNRLTMAACIDAVEEAYAAAGGGDLTSTPRQVAPSAGGARLLTVSAASYGMGALVSLAYSGRPVGTERRKDAQHLVEKVITVFDPETGQCRAVIGGNYLLWLYTGAMGAVAIKHLASEGASTLALLGSGRQARTALLGALEVMDLQRVHVWSRRLENAQSFAEDHRDMSAEVVACSTVDEAVASADVIITVTTAGEPLVHAGQLPVDCHINSIGAHYPDRREIASDVVASSTVFVDTVEQARVEKGELLLAEREGAFSFDDVADELGTVVQRGGRRSRTTSERTLFCSSGSGIELLGAAVAALRTGEEQDGPKSAFN